MRKAIGILVTLALILSLALWIVWENKTFVAAHILSRHLHVPVDIQHLDISKTTIELEKLWIGTPPNSKISTSFSAKSIDVVAKTQKILKNPLSLDSIRISNIYVGIEYSSDGSTNWSYMLKDDSKVRSDKAYLIRSLVLENLTIEVTQANGQTQQYPTIRKMEFQDISNETGIPVGAIEKIIFRLMMKNLMKKLDLFQPLELPLQLVPGLFQ